MAAVEIGLKAALPAARTATGRGPEEPTGSFVEIPKLYNGTLAARPPMG